MNKLNKYIMQLFGVELREKPLSPSRLKALPFYLREMYRIKSGFLLNREILLLEQKTSENQTTDQYRKQITLLENTFNLPAVLVLQKLEAYNRKRLIEKQIAFIIPGKQLFVPQLLMDLRENRNITSNKKETIQPAAQCILLYHLLKENIEKMNFKMLAEKTTYTQMTITRAAKDLEEKQLCRIEGTSERRITFFERGKTLWEKALPFLQNPLKRKIYINDNIAETLIFRAGFSALSNLANIADEQRECFAISKTDYMYLKKHNRINITNKTEGRICVEIWKYPPGLIANQQIVDPLSLYLTFKDIQDERVEMEIEKLVDRLW